MGKAPAFQLYASDFYMDTAGWTVAQVGAYTRLLMYEWVNGHVPSDMASISRIAGITDARTMYKMWSGTVGKKFISNGGNLLYNNKLEEEREKQSKRAEIQAQKGLSGAKKRWKDHIAPAIAQVIPKDSSSSSSSSSSSKKEKEYSVPFEDFWREYPVKKGKHQAFKEWEKLNPSPDITIPALKAQIENKARCEKIGEFCAEFPYPERWIRLRRWEDEVNVKSNLSQVQPRPRPPETKDPAWIADALSKGWKI